MIVVRNRGGRRVNLSSGFTLVEVVFSIALMGLAFGGILYGYVRTAQQAEWSSYSLAAHSAAMQGVEQARSAKWDPTAYPAVDELGTTSVVQTVALDLPVTGGSATFGTNYLNVTTVSIYPPIRELRSDCVWTLPGRRVRGLYTNTVVTLRTADQ